MLLNMHPEKMTLFTEYSNCKAPKETKAHKYIVITLDYPALQMQIQATIWGIPSQHTCTLRLYHVYFSTQANA